MRQDGRTRLLMVRQFLADIEEPYQYGDNYGDLVEYMKMLINGEVDYPETKREEKILPDSCKANGIHWDATRDVTQFPDVSQKEDGWIYKQREILGNSKEFLDRYFNE